MNPTTILMKDNSRDSLPPPMPTGLQGAIDDQNAGQEEATNETETLLRALFGGSEALAEDDIDHSVCFGPSLEQVSFCELVLLLQLKRRPYHLVTMTGPFNAKRLIRDYRDKVYRSERRVNRRRKVVVDRFLLCLGEGVFVFLESGAALTVYGPTPQSATRAALGFRRYKIAEVAKKKPTFCLVGIAEGGPYAQDIEVETSAPISTSELALHYGDEFIEWERRWIERLKQRRSGISILFGPPGCGKTSYLRSLMTRLQDEFVCYFIPLSCFDVLASPSFVGFWLNQSESNRGKRQIALLEDAEELLAPRDEANRTRVSNLLNIGDGFLGEHLKLHVIATTNVAIQKLDPAVLRPGRLIAIRQFRRLSRAEALRLCGAKGLNLPEQEENFSLAEIYNPPQSITSLADHHPVGFAQPDGKH